MALFYWNTMIIVSIIVFSLLFSLIESSNGKLKASSVFRSDEVLMHKYAAILAATEPTRQQSQDQIRNSLSYFQNFWNQLRGMGFNVICIAIKLHSRCAIVETSF